MMAPSPLSLLITLCAILSVSVSGQDYQGPGYLACPVVDLNVTLLLSCFYEDVNCTEAQAAVCNSGEILNETISADALTYYLPLQCDCIVTDGCPDTCEFIMVEDLPTPPPSVTGLVNYTGFGNVTCPLADLLTSDEESCIPDVLDPTSCGTCNTTFEDPNFGYQLGDTTITYPLICECLVVLNCPNTCTFVATDGPVEAPIAAPVPAPTTTDSPVSAPTSDETTAPVSAPTSDKGNVTGPISAPTRPVSAPSAPIRSPVTAPSSTSFATVTTSHKVCAVTAVLTMMFVSAF